MLIELARMAGSYRLLFKPCARCLELSAARATIGSAAPNETPPRLLQAAVQKAHQPAWRLAVTPDDTVTFRSF